MERNETMWCVSCGQRFTDEEAAGANACPACYDAGVPCSTADDVSVDVNWHELRVLGIWAENYANSLTKVDQSFLQTVHAITRRLEAQYPNKPPLTLSGEISQIHKEYGRVKTEGIAKPTLVVVNGPGAVGHSRS